MGLLVWLFVGDGQAKKEREVSFVIALGDEKSTISWGVLGVCVQDWRGCLLSRRSPLCGETVFETHIMKKKKKKLVSFFCLTTHFHLGSPQLRENLHQLGL